VETERYAPETTPISKAREFNRGIWMTSGESKVKSHIDSSFVFLVA
jgi:hypothetical protein